jgi:hypothetical protein
MSETYDALVKNINFQGTTPQSIRFQVEAPPDLPDFFSKRTDDDELKRLERHTASSRGDRAFDIGRVPVQYDGSWEIAWDELDN